MLDNTALKLMSNKVFPSRKGIHSGDKDADRFGWRHCLVRWMRKRQPIKTASVRISCCLLVAPVGLFSACSSQKVPDYVPPKEAAIAVSAAIHYAQTNGFENPVVSEARLSGGDWMVVLRSRNEPSPITVIEVSPEGEIINYSGPR